jgi:hypothetical protein
MICHLRFKIYFGTLLLLGTNILLRRAQNDFFRFDTNYPSRSQLPFIDGNAFNIKELVDDVRSSMHDLSFDFPQVQIRNNPSLPLSKTGKHPKSRIDTPR